jgi:hypothetical protein
MRSLIHRFRTSRGPGASGKTDFLGLGKIIMGTTGKIMGIRYPRAFCNGRFPKKKVLEHKNLLF